MITSEGTIIRLRVEDISTLGRVTQGVTLMKMDEGIKVVSIARVEIDESSESPEGFESDVSDEGFESNVSDVSDVSSESPEDSEEEKG